tara:strand:+ start:1374 stop:2303 length:930 start_codon:yes stop_codon:yes gene_type:complete
MARSGFTDDEFISVFEEIGPAATASHFGISERNIHKRRRRLENSLGRIIRTPSDYRTDTPKKHHITVKNGTVFVASDFHFWPGDEPTAYRAFVKLLKEHQPKAIILNGDVLDGAAISRHPPLGWDNIPSVQQEVKACQERLNEIKNAAPKAKNIWPIGNHDSRFEMKLAKQAPEFVKVSGFKLKDHFPAWKPCYSCYINEDVVVKHRLGGGTHATYNNTLKSGMNIVTGHLHGQKVTPFTDYRGTRYGVDAGFMSDPDAPQFDYTEDNPKDWRAGFSILTFHKGTLLPPELVTVFDADRVTFRGELIKV